ncbi:MAG: hypothetical protein AB7F86_10030 [Bdellovibrionales bacterium]
MNNRTGFQRLKTSLADRWSSEDVPGGKPRIQINLIVKDFVVFLVLPLSSILLFKMCESALSANGKPKRERTTSARGNPTEVKSQIIQFVSTSGGVNGVAKRAPGTIVRVRLMNAVETLGSAPVHAQILDANLGRSFLGGTLIGDATSDGNTNRIKIDFKFARYPNRTDVAIPIQARALSEDGTFGLQGKKKEGLFARAAIRSSTGGSTQSEDGNGQDLKQIIARALASGLMQELGSEAQIASNQAQVLTLKPMTEFVVELIDYFPGQAR